MTLSVPSAHQDSERDEVFRAIEDRVLLAGDGDHRPSESGAAEPRREGLIVTEPKTAKSKRFVTISAPAQELLVQGAPGPGR
jgi:hypothetical protein